MVIELLSRNLCSYIHIVSIFSFLVISLPMFMLNLVLCMFCSSCYCFFLLKMQIRFDFVL